MSYDNAPVPFKLEDLPRFLEEQLQIIAEESRLPSAERIRLEELNAAPDRPSNGDIAYADGTNWNPGSGEGFYGYENGSWTKL